MLFLPESHTLTRIKHSGFLGEVETCTPYLEEKFSQINFRLSKMRVVKTLQLRNIK